MFLNRVEQESESEVKAVKADDVDVDSEARYWVGSLAGFSGQLLLQDAELLSYVLLPIGQLKSLCF